MAHVLIVDDDPQTRSLYWTVLEKEGHSVVSAENGAVALDLMRNNTFTLIITDLNMPVMKGDELAGKVKAKLLGIPILMVSNEKPEQHFEDDFLQKPFETSELLEKVKGWLK